MSSVTQRINQVTQPRGGFISPSKFSLQKLDDGQSLNDEENIHATLIGLAVDYLTRFAMGGSAQEAFDISCEGARFAEEFFSQNGKVRDAQMLLSNIVSLDDNSIFHACKLVSYDVWVRNPMSAMMAKGPGEINPDKSTIQNIRTMVERSVAFWNDYGPIIKDGFTFEYNGYTKVVDTGDGDFLTKDTLWDFKVSKAKPTSKNTLQLLMYWIMGQHSGQEIYKGINKLGIFNPRRNEVYLLNVETIPKDIIATVERDVICYEV